MQAVILAGGFGSRISEESQLKPKPLVMIGGKPILWHIMKIYSHYGINDFVVCCGYKGQMIKDFFEKKEESWKVSCVDTGLETMTGNRLKKIESYVDDTFHFTYGDTLSSINISELMKVHKNKGKIGTVTACQPPEKYGILEIDDHNVIKFSEKPAKKDIWVNGGFFVLEPKIFDYIEEENTSWENDTMVKLVNEGELSALKHHGFYQPMDTLKEKNLLNELWNSNNAAWKVW